MNIELHSRVEDLELSDRLEVFDVLRRDLSDFQKSDAAIVVDDGTTFDIGLGLVGDLHQELRLRIDHMLENPKIDIGTEIVDVGDEEVLFAGGNELVEETRVLQSIEDVTVTGRVPLIRKSGELS